MPKPTPEQLAHCIAQVTRFIPSPRLPRAKEQKSKFGLKVGQLLGSPAGEIFKVVETDSLGLTLETPDGKVCRLTDKLELTHYTREKAKKASRSKRKSVQSEHPDLFGAGDSVQRSDDLH